MQAPQDMRLRDAEIKRLRKQISSDKQRERTLGLTSRDQLLALTLSIMTNMNSQVAAAFVIQIHRRRSTSSNASCAAMEQHVKFVEWMYINSDVDLLLDSKNTVDVGHRPLQV